MNEKGAKVWSIFTKVIKLLFGFLSLHNSVIGTKDDTESKNENK